MNKEVTYKEISAAVADLKHKSLIKRDADLIELLGYSKGTISAYLSGKTKPSKDFIDKFEDVFKLKLLDFAINNASNNDNTLNDLAAGNRDLCRAQKVIADANYDLVQMLKDLIARGLVEKRSDVPSIDQAAQELLGLIRQGKLKSLEEVGAVLSRYVAQG